MKLAMVIAALALVLAACGSSSKATSTAGAASAVTSAPTKPVTNGVTAVPATATVVPATATQAPTTTPAPTNTPAPTATPKPTATPMPTATPTEVPPTATATPGPEPKVYDGSGDNVVDIEKPGGPGLPALVYITGNADSGYFGVTAFDANGTQLDLLVNTSEMYEGLVPLDFAKNDETTRLQVKSSGAWHIEIRPLASARAIADPGEATGTGDDVFIVTGSVETAHITGNADRGYFGVFGYGKNKNLLVNTTDPYDGTVILAKETRVIQVKAVGGWAITFK